MPKTLHLLGFFYRAIHTRNTHHLLLVVSSGLGKKIRDRDRETVKANRMNSSKGVSVNKYIISQYAMKYIAGRM